MEARCYNADDCGRTLSDWECPAQHASLRPEHCAPKPLTDQRHGGRAQSIVFRPEGASKQHWYVEDQKIVRRDSPTEERPVAVAGRERPACLSLADDGVDRMPAIDPRLE